MASPHSWPEYFEEVRKLMGKYGQEAPKTMEAFAALHEQGSVDSAISSKTKELIALGIAIAVHCEGCIAFHIHDALEAGATKKEIVDTIGVAILMGGGPAVMYGTKALEALEQFENNK
jgi:AhpD family alkylhydroperoxidase